MKTIRSLFIILLSLYSLSGCTSTELASSLYKKQTRPHYKVGTPYVIDGKVYYPAEVASYVEEGEASWYGPGFHGKQTANGETFDKLDMSAAHRTLPMPSVVRVTNLENGRQVILRVNDRGPFARNRVIDVSKSASKALDFHQNGTTHVRVEFMPIESQIVAEAAKQGQVMPLEEALARAQDDMPTIETAPRTAVAMAELPPTPQYQPASYDVPMAANAPESQEKMNTLREPANYRPAAKAAASGHVYVQAGAYGTKAKAQQVAQRLESLGPVRMDTITRGGVKLHRVRVVAPSKDNAYKIQSKMATMGFGDAKLLKE